MNQSNFQSLINNSIRQEIQRFESVHPSIYAIYALIGHISDLEIADQIQKHIVCIEGMMLVKWNTTFLFKHKRYCRLLCEQPRMDDISCCKRFPYRDCGYFTIWKIGVGSPIFNVK
jgi:hypothetical protein